MAYRNLYFETIKRVLDQAIESYSHRTGTSISDIDAQIANHIETTSSEHYNPDPNINYKDPLCRLGYLFVHAGANAYLFEQTITESRDLSHCVNQHDNRALHVCTIGGGPGTELLGLIKYGLSRQTAPSDLHFTVIDNVPEWGESWELLAEACQELMSQHLGHCPIIHRGFYPLNATDPSSYNPYAWLLEKVDVIVFNYLLSENQVRLPEFEGALSIIKKRTKDETLFVVIDRLERNTTFRQKVIDVFYRSGFILLTKLRLKPPSRHLVEALV
jgi:hypothetical protein